MMTRFLILCFLLAGSAQSVSQAAAQTSAPSPTPAAISAPTPPSDAVVQGWARDWLRHLQMGNIDRSQLNDQMNAALTPDVVSRLAGELGSLGSPLSFNLANKQSLGAGLTQYLYRIRFDNGVWDETLVLDDYNKIAVLRFTVGQ